MTARADELVSALPVLRRYALSLTRDEAYADDLVQEAVARALASADAFDGGNLRGWVAVIMRNYFFVEWHKRRREVEDVGEVRASALPDKAADPLTRLLMREQAARVAALPPVFRETLVLLAEGHTCEDAGALMGVPAGTVKSRAHRARSMLGAY